MSITDLKTKVSGAPAPADLTFMLSQAQDVLDHLQDDYGATALGAVDNPAGEKALATIKQQITAARDRVEMLKAALVASEKQAAELIQAQRKALQKSQYLAAAKHLDLRDAAGAAYETAIAEATKQYRLLQIHTAKAQHACPLGMEWPGTLDEANIMLLARGAGWKFVTGPEHGRPANWDGYALPGMSAGDARYIDNPAATPPIADRLSKESADIKAVLKSKLIP